MNADWEHEELKCYVELLPDYKDPRQTKFMVPMGYRQEEILVSLKGKSGTKWPPLATPEF